MDRFFRIVFELDCVLVFLEVCTACEGRGNLAVALLFPASSIAVNHWLVDGGLANGLDPAVAACAVEPDFSLTRLLGAWLARVALFLATMTAGAALFSASLTAPFFHQLLLIRDALAGHVTDLLAFVATVEIQVACLATVRVRFLAKDVCQELLAAVAEPVDNFKTGRARAVVAAE